MSGYLQSGRRRDLCILLYGSEGMRGQELKTSLETHYDTRLDPGTFYSTLDSLAERGHLESSTEGVHDVYALTDAGTTALEEHLVWIDEEVPIVEVLDDG